MADPIPSELQVRPFHISMCDDLAELLASDETASRCWCMWFIDSVKDFHAAGADGNRARFEDLARSTEEPMGLLAYQHGRAVGWCAIGPKERFARAVRTPTLRGHAASAKKTWFAPCFFVRQDMRRGGITKLLLEKAVLLAAQHGAELVEGFPVSGYRPATSGDRQVGTEGVFISQGFVPAHRPSANRVVMQRSVRGTSGEA